MDVAPDPPPPATGLVMVQSPAFEHPPGDPVVVVDPTMVQQVVVDGGAVVITSPAALYHDHTRGLNEARQASFRNASEETKELLKWGDQAAKTRPWLWVVIVLSWTKIAMAICAGFFPWLLLKRTRGNDTTDVIYYLYDVRLCVTSSGVEECGTVPTKGFAGALVTIGFLAYLAFHTMSVAGVLLERFGALARGTARPTPSRAANMPAVFSGTVLDLMFSITSFTAGRDYFVLSDINFSAWDETRWLIGYNLSAAIIPISFISVVIALVADIKSYGIPGMGRTPGSFPCCCLRRRESPDLNVDPQILLLRLTYLENNESIHLRTRRRLRQIRGPVPPRLRRLFASDRAWCL
jgi:hypothetical protein